MELLRVTGPGEWEHFVSKSFYVLSLNSVSKGFTATGRLTEIGRGIRLAELETGVSGLQRTPGLIASAPSDDLLFLIQLAGQARIEQAGQQLLLRAGHATFCDPSVPYRIVSGGQQIVTMVPRHEVLPPRSRAAHIRLHDLSMTLAPLRVFRLLAEEITSDPGSEHDAERFGVGNAASELLRSAAVMAAEARLDLRSWSNETRLHAVKEFLLARLSDPTLTMERVAAANGMSVRQLTAVFEPDDSPAAFLRRERLRRARQELVDPRFAGVPISDIGARWGYPNPSTFGRAYRRAFGETPLEARRNGFGQR
ncbi:helix-turn-helix domain-containing protein [Streptomyces sp. NPDC050535]|uniref:helix-turn-helix domain-containing protein n=1 Tax=Streptomyces sp. NPDC050535 TaxID=3365626 RepID=UPI00379879BB